MGFGESGLITITMGRPKNRERRRGRESEGKKRELESWQG